MAAKPKGPVFRVSGLPASQSHDELHAALTTWINDKFSDKEKAALTATVGIVPSCYYSDQERVALVEFHGGIPDFLSELSEDLTREWQGRMGNLAVNFDRNFFGFTQLYVPQSNTPVTADIIAITGLDGHAYGSWRGKGSLGSMWLRDFLSNDLPSCRTMTYGYNSKLSLQGFSTILDYSRQLIEEIQLIRNTGPLKQRPLFFIAHSFGGIILAQCLVKAAQTGESRNSAISAIYKATYGMLLFGIPHRGLLVEDIRKMLARYDDHPRNALLNQICTKSEFLATQVDAFRNIIYDRKVVSFYETMQTRRLEFDEKSKSWKRTGDFVTQVDTNSALLQLPDSAEKKIPLDADHSMMVKFDARHNRGYASAQDKLKQFEMDAPKVIQARFRKRKFSGYTDNEDIVLTKRETRSTVEEAEKWIRSNHYTAERLKVERLSGARLPMDQCYINLAIVEWSKTGKPLSGDGNEMPPSFSIFHRQKVETPDKSIQVKLPAIFKERAGLEGQVIRPRRILIRGRAGVGKSTLCKKMVHDFMSSIPTDLQRSWSEMFERLLWLPLRHLKRYSSSGYNLNKLLYDEFFRECPNGESLAREMWHAIANKKVNKTLFILDGLDEISELLEGHHEMFDFVVNLLNQPNVIITSRPSAHLPAGLQNLHLELETIGFYPEQVKSYLDADPAIKLQAHKIQTFLQQHWLMQGLVRIPIQLDALCYTWDDFEPEMEPGSMTDMYSAIVERLWKKDVIRLGKKFGGSISLAQPAEIERGVQAEIALLECLAFNGLRDNIIEFTPGHRNRLVKQFPHQLDLLLDETLSRLSFLRTSEPLSKTEHQHYHFIHLTFQEYFAARYFVRQWRSKKPLEYFLLGQRNTESTSPTDPVDFLQKYKYTARYNILWRFVVGLVDSIGEAKHFIDIIEKEPRDILGPAHQRLVMHCLNEVFGILPTRMALEQRLSEWLVFECNFSHSAHLASEMEFPDHIIDKILVDAPDDIKTTILESLGRRAAISPLLIRRVSCFLRHGDGGIRRSAVQVLGEQPYWAEEIALEVEARLEDKDKGVRQAVVHVLRRRLDLPERLLHRMATRLKDSDQNIRLDVTQVLSHLGQLPDVVLHQIAARLQDNDRESRHAVVEILGHRSDMTNEVLLEVVTRLRDVDSDIRVAALEQLGEHDDLPEKVMREVIARLKDQDEDVRLAALDVLIHKSHVSEIALQQILGLLQQKDPGLRTAFLEHLQDGASLLSAEVIQEVAKSLKHNDEDVRIAALQVLAEAELSHENIQEVTMCLKDDGENVRIAALQVLEDKISCNVCCQEVLMCLEDEDDDVRESALKVLSDISDLTVEELEKVVICLADDSEDIRIAAIDVVKTQVNPPDAIMRKLAMYLKDEDEDVRIAAAEALQNQSISEEVAQEMISLLVDANTDVRVGAVLALSGHMDLPNVAIAVVAQLKADNPNLQAAALEALQLRGSFGETHREGIQMGDRKRDMPVEKARDLVRYLTGEVVEGRYAVPQDLSSQIFREVATLLQDANSVVRLRATLILQEQPYLSGMIIQKVRPLLQDETGDIRSAAIRTLGKVSGSDLSIDIIKEVAARLKDKDETVQDEASTFLLKYGEFYHILLNSHDAAFFYQVLLRRSFQEELSWYFHAGKFWVSTPNVDSSHSSDLEHTPRDIMVMVNEARPKCYPSTHN